MNYIGSKRKLIPFIKETIHQTMGSDLSQKVFCDLFAGTGIVGQSFKSDVKQIISCDLEYYSYVLNRNYIGNYQNIDYQPLLKILNELPGVEGFIFQQYAQSGNTERLYFSAENGKRIDAIRLQIQNWKLNGIISEDVYFFLLASLLKSADKVANTASVYGAYLKKLKKTAQKSLVLEPALFELTPNKHKVFQADANTLIKEISGDILYLDPPYNARQYGANYHLLNTIAQYDVFEPKGKTGLPIYNKSMYCRKNEVKHSFEALIDNARFEYIFFSYNNEGLMNEIDIKGIMSRYGDYCLATTEYQRFKADKTENRNHKAKVTVEYLHVLKKNKL